MANIYIANVNIWHGHKRHFRGDVHFVNLQNGMIAITGEFNDSCREDAFVSSGALAIDHICSASKIPAEVVTHVAHLGLTVNHSTSDLRKALKKLHPAF